jgi:membrane protease YdiL (CAAX protease family)
VEEWNVDGVIGIAGIVALLLLGGVAVATWRRDGVSFRWLCIAAALVVLEDVLLTGAYGLLPALVPWGRYNWQGKLLALAGTIAVASTPAFGWRASGLTLRQAPGSRRFAMVTAAVYGAIFVAIAVLVPDGPVSTERLAFQATMPGLEEEAFYRGVLLLALNRAFPGRVRFLGAEWGWGAVASSALFGLAHAFGVTDGAVHFDPLVTLLTGAPSLLAAWMVLRTRSVLLPTVLHNFGNTIVLVV